ncbi:hypothetical protein FRC08_002604 [Ceratobasidium sp. 394]|nr:hypothetical protein FRC08_002604 [Ceratobasidium sp. 394]
MSSLNSRSKYPSVPLPFTGNPPTSSSFNSGTVLLPQNTCITSKYERCFRCMGLPGSEGWHWPYDIQDSANFQSAIFKASQEPGAEAHSPANWPLLTGNNTCAYQISHKKISKTSHQCSICFKCFRRPGALEDHYNTHYGRKPHTCPDCSVGFAAKSNLQRHQKRKHPQASGNQSRRHMYEPITNMTYGDAVEWLSDGFSHAQLAMEVLDFDSIMRDIETGTN